MRALAGYVLCAAALVALGGWGLTEWLGGGAASAVWWAAGLAFGVQVVAFAALVAARRRGAAVMAAWGVGTLLRLGVVLVAAVWLVWSKGVPAAELLLSLAGFLFVLLLLEPVFFRIGMRS